MLRRRRGGWTLRVGGEPDSALALDGHRRRAARGGAAARRDRPGAGRALDRARDRDAAGGGGPAAAGGPPPRRRGAAGRLRRLGRGAAARRPTRPRSTPSIARGCVGLSLPASALAGPAALERVGPLLARLEAHGCRCSSIPARSSAPGEPAVAAALPPWWPALTDYVAQMQAAWFAFLHGGRRAPPAPAGAVRDDGRRGAAAAGALRRPRRGGAARARPAGLLRHLLLRAADAGGDGRRGRPRPARLRLRPARRRRRGARARPPAGAAAAQRQPPFACSPLARRETSHDRDRADRPAARARPDRGGAARRRHRPRGPAGALVPPRRARPDPAHLQAAAARRAPRRLAALLVPRPRHRLPRPRPLGRRRRRRRRQRPRGAAGARPPGRRPDRPRRRRRLLASTSAPATSTASSTPAASPPSPSTPTRRRWCGWAATRSSPAASSAATPSPTRRSCASSARPYPEGVRLRSLLVPAVALVVPLAVPPGAAPAAGPETGTIVNVELELKANNDLRVGSRPPTKGW